MSLYHELKRRNVFRVGAAYIVAAWLIIQVAETIFPLYGFGDMPARITVTVLAIGFPIFLAFSWLFELTPEGLKKEKDIDRTVSITRETGKQLDRIIIALLAIAVGYFAIDKFVLDPARDAELVEVAAQQARSEALVEYYGEQSIAVLPFVNMSAEPEQEYFSDGISEELLNLLAKIPELRVISRSSAFSYKGKDIKLAQVAEELKVAHILEGSVRKAGDKVRITAQLIDARSDTHLWSETYDRQLDDIFAIQDEIAVTVVKQLKITLFGAVPKVQETNPEAYALLLQARYLSRQGSAEAYNHSITLYQKAQAIEPNYAATWSGLARNYINLTGKGMLPRAEGYPLAQDMLQKALAIDPDHAPAHARLGYIAMVYGNDLALAARHFEQALRLDPFDTDIIGNATMLLSHLGRFDEAIALIEYTTTRDPVNAIGHSNLGSVYLFAGLWDEAIASYQTVLRLSPDYIGTHYKIGTALLFKGEGEEALAEFSLEEGDEEYRVKGQALALYSLGRHTEYRAKLDELIKRWGNQWPSEVAHVYAYARDFDQAFLWLDRAIEQNEEGLSGQFRHPFYQPIQSDERWAKLLRSVGSSPEQLNAIEFNATQPK